MAITVYRDNAEAKTVSTLAELRECVLAVAKTVSDEGGVAELVAELDEAVYKVDEPIVFSAKETPELRSVRLTLRAALGARPLIWSNERITEPFEKVEGTDYYVCRLPKNESGEYPKFRDLYTNTRRMRLASSPQWLNPFPLLPEERRGEKALEGIYIPYEYAEAIEKVGLGRAELKMYVQWEHVNLHATGIDLSEVREHEGKKYALMTFGEDFSPRYTCGINPCNNTGNRQTFIKNSRAFLSEPGDFVYNASLGELYVVPNEDIDKCSFYYPKCESLLVFEDMEGVTVEGLTFTGVSSRYIVDNGYTAGQSNCERIAKRLESAAIFIRNARELSVRDCTFRAIGCNAIQMHGRTVTANICGNRFVDIAMGGVFIGDYKNMPLINVRTASAEKVAYYFSCVAYNVSIVNNYFKSIAYDYPNAYPIYLSLCDGARILHNTIENCGLCGISGGWISPPVEFYPGEQFNLRDVEIAYNRIHNYMQVLRDGGAIYVCGGNASIKYAERFNKIHDNYVSLDHPGELDRRGIYLDASSSNYDVYNNVIRTSVFPLFTQYHVPSQYTHHNRSHHIYSTDPIEDGNHVPERDTLMSDIFVESDFDALLKKYPHAAEICKAAGCTPDIRQEGEKDV